MYPIRIASTPYVYGNSIILAQFVHCLPALNEPSHNRNATSSNGNSQIAWLSLHSEWGFSRRWVHFAHFHRDASSVLFSIMSGPSNNRNYSTQSHSVGVLGQINFSRISTFSNLFPFASVCLVSISLSVLANYLPRCSPVFSKLLDWMTQERWICSGRGYIVYEQQLVSLFFLLNKNQFDLAFSS